MLTTNLGVYSVKICSEKITTTQSSLLDFFQLKVQTQIFQFIVILNREMQKVFVLEKL